MAIAEVVVTQDFPRSAADIHVPCWYCKEKIAYLHNALFNVSRVALDGTNEIWLTPFHMNCFYEELKKREQTT